MRYFLTVLMVGLLSASVAFGGTIRGIVKDSDTQEPLIGANVVVEGTAMGATTDYEGFFLIEGVPEGQYTVTISYIGYKEYQEQVNVGAGETVTLDVVLTPIALSAKAINVVADRAIERETPVAFTNVRKVEIQARLGSQDIPMVLNTTPSVYATPQGGGAGDARINVRGFDQRNVAIMINGVPVNDMENGWVYWSNWDGVGDATSSIQIQRGLSAVNLATPSIGGTMNIITDPAAVQAGGVFKQELGAGNFLKSTLVLNTGLLNDKYAFSFAVVRKTGDGIVDATWTDAWAYYFGAVYNINPKNRLEFYALGAPQRHGQNLYKQNIAVYSRELAESLSDYDPEAFTKYNEAGQKFNQNWAPVSSSYKGKQAVENDVFDRHDPNFINERENFYHKPQVNLNWFSQISERMNLFTVLYYSGGRGGGTGTKGSLVRRPFVEGNAWFESAPWRWDWDATIARNDTSSNGSLGILRNSRNNQWTIGAISKAYYKFSNSFEGVIGVDWRTAEIEHYREVRDLLGGDYFYREDSDFWTTEEQKRRGLGDKFDYFFTNTVDWFGTFAQGEYTSGSVSAYGMAGYSQIKYSHTNHFRMAPDGNELHVESDWIQGFQLKGGLAYRVNPDVQLYTNLGYVSKVPIFDNVISDRAGEKATDPKNEKFTSLEAGANLSALEGQMNIKASVYHTFWKDRARSIGVTNPDGSEGLVFITGMNALHQGLELELAYQPNRLIRFDGAASFGNWRYTDDVIGVYKNYVGGQLQTDTASYYVKDLKVGDAPQTQIALMGTVYPVKGLQAQLVFRHYANHYAAWDPFSRTDPNDRTQSWKVPNYSVVDAHVLYNLPMNIGPVQPQFFLHVFNLFDELYIQDATDNSRFNAWDHDHDADDAEVFVGLPRYVNAGLQLNF